MSIQEEFNRYKNAFGLVDNASALEGKNSGNSILFHAHYVWTLVKRGLWTHEEATATARAIAQCEVTLGLIARVPEDYWPHMDQEGLDDQIGYCSMSAADSNLDFAAMWLRYGRSVRVPIREVLAKSGHPWLARLFGWIKLGWVFNNVAPETMIEWYRDDAGNMLSKPNWGSYMGDFRYPQIIAHAQFCTKKEGERPGLWRRFWWAFSVWQTARFVDKGGTDQWVLSGHLVAGFRSGVQKSLICEWASKSYMERLYQRWPGGLNGVFAPYFGMEHPIPKYGMLP